MFLLLSWSILHLPALVICPPCPLVGMDGHGSWGMGPWWHGLPWWVGDHGGAWGPVSPVCPWIMGP